MVSASLLTPTYAPPPPLAREFDALVGLACRLVGARSGVLLLPVAPTDTPRIVAAHGALRVQVDAELTHDARVPVLLDDGRTGVLAVSEPSSGRPFDEVALGSLREFAALIADRVAAGSRGQRIVQAREDERRRIAQELHDETGHVLIATIWRLECDIHTLPPEASAAREALERTHRSLIDCVEVLHDTVEDLPPRLLQDLGLADALRVLIERFQEGNATQAELQLPDRLPTIGPPLALVIFRVVQEALTNVRKHARAGRVWVRLEAYPGVLVVSVEDDGVGCANAAAIRRARLGVNGMRERVETLAGSFALGPRMGGGTRLTARLPLRSSK